MNNRKRKSLFSPHKTKYYKVPEIKKFKQIYLFRVMYLIHICMTGLCDPGGSLFKFYSC